MFNKYYIDTVKEKIFGVPTGYGNKIKWLSQLVFIASVCFGVLGLLITVAPLLMDIGYISAEVVFAGFFSGLVNCATTVFKGFVLKFLIYGFGIIVESFENKQ